MIAVWTDFGGVMTPPVAQTLQALCTRLGLDPTVLGAAMGKVTRGFGTTDLMEPLDTPLVTEAEWLDRLRAALAEDAGVSFELTSLGPVWFDGRETNRAWADELRELRARGAFVGLLSNMPPAWDEHWRRMTPPAAHYDDVVLSFEVGLRKPQPEIFALAAARAGVEPGRCVLVDDMEKNCAGAEAAGWRAVRFTDTAAAAAELDRLLVSASPNAG